MVFYNVIGIKNQNGRIYPREILVRGGKKYTKEFIKQRRNYG